MAPNSRMLQDPSSISSACMGGACGTFAKLRTSHVGSPTWTSTLGRTRSKIDSDAVPRTRKLLVQGICTKILKHSSLSPWPKPVSPTVTATMTCLETVQNKQKLISLQSNESDPHLDVPSVSVWESRDRINTQNPDDKWRSCGARQLHSSGHQQESRFGMSLCTYMLRLLIVLATLHHLRPRIPGLSRQHDVFSAHPPGPAQRMDLNRYGSHGGS